MGRSHLVHEAWGLSLRKGSWKYVPAGKTRERLGPWDTFVVEEPGALYDLSEDPGERNDLAHSRPEVVSEMRELLVRIRSEPDGDEPATLR